MGHQPTRSPRASRGACLTIASCLVASAAVAAACSGGSDTPEPSGVRDDTPTEETRARLRSLDAPVVVVTGDDVAELALATSTALFEAAPVAALAPAGDVDAVAEAGRQARERGIPVLLAPTATVDRSDGARGDAGRGADRSDAAAEVSASAQPAALRHPSRSSVDAGAIAAELDRLGTATVVTFGFSEPPDGLPGDVTAVAGPDADAELARHAPPESPDGVVALVDRDDPLVGAASVTVEAARIPVVPVTDGDPRLDERSREVLADLEPDQVVTVGGPGRFGSPDRVAGLVATAVAGTELPGGGQVMFPGRQLVALYGHPGTAALGVMGEQPADAAVGRAASMAAPYEALGDVPVVPTFEVIATIASSAPGADGDYSSESELDHLRPWVDAAADAGMYVILDLQPGHTDFLTQAKLYEELLRQPHVGLALDPEWRLAPGQRHLQTIGSVDADEVNATIDWLADLVRAHALPQKLLVVHQFRLDMIEGRERVATPPEVAVLFQMDGDGTPGQKMETWGAITADPPPGTWFGWKNFIDEDEPMFSPAETVAVDPTPLYISYQ
jgi:hypothetical protein